MVIERICRVAGDVVGWAVKANISRLEIPLVTFGLPNPSLSSSRESKICRSFEILFM